MEKGSLIPYCKKIREFKKGAFDFAVKNQVPVVPMVFQFREPKGIRKLWKRKQDVTLTILGPIMSEGSSEELKEKIYQEMK